MTNNASQSDKWGDLAGLLSDQQDKTAVANYIGYCLSLSEAKNNNNQPKNPWIQHRSAQYLADCFNAVSADGLVLDGKHITLQSTGISYDYVAYRNKMLLVYPESTIDMALVYQDDRFCFKKENGKVLYSHELNNPFGQSEDDIIGGYCVIKNKRGEFITTLSKADFDKHRKVAKTDYIWKNWLVEMCLKTLIKKACKKHFDDIYQNIETIDNENYDVEQPLGISVETKAEIEAIQSVGELEGYYKANSGKNAGCKEDFIKACATRKEQIVQEQMKKDEHGEAA